MILQTKFAVERKEGSDRSAIKTEGFATTETENEYVLKSKHKLRLKFLPLNIHLEKIFRYEH